MLYSTNVLFIGCAIIMWFTVYEWDFLDHETKSLRRRTQFKQSLQPKNNHSSDICYYCWALIHHARIIIGCSKLNLHLRHNRHVLPAGTCHCGADNESPTNLFFVFPLYAAKKIQLHNKVLPQASFNVHTLVEIEILA